MENKKPDNNNLTITIKTPRGDKEWTFPKTIKVQEIIDEIVEHYQFASNGNYKLYLDSDPNNELQPERPLVSYGVKDGDILIFADLGIAV